MSDSNAGAKKTGIPSWQAQLKETTPTEGDTEASAPSPSRETVIEQAKKFLEEDEVRNASTDKKIAFLEGKGLAGAEIQELLGITRNPEASSSSPSPAASETSPPPPSSSSQTQIPPAPQQAYTNPPKRDTPPIITYPEFLTTPVHPAPLITTSRLLTTLYLFGSLTALLYGTNAYLITPMIANLTAARLEFAETSKANLLKLVNKLEGVVSEIPPSIHHKESGKGEEDQRSESDEDPTELFHRDVGIQTSLPSSPLSSRPASPVPSTTLVSTHTTTLNTISTSLSSLLENSTEEGATHGALSTEISGLREYLDRLAYVAPSYSYGVSAYSNQNNKEEDEIGRVKAGIRGVKGVLLSARSFPAVGSGGGTGVVSTGR